MTSANLLVVLLISTVVGALVGLGLGGVITHPLWLGMISGFLATILAGMVRNYLVSRGVLGPKGAPIPAVVILYTIIASMAGSAGAVEVVQAKGSSAPVLIGTLAGLFSAILTALLMITYYMHPREK